jgi:hypothetical protein
MSKILQKISGKISQKFHDFLPKKPSTGRPFFNDFLGPLQRSFFGVIFQRIFREFFRELLRKFLMKFSEDFLGNFPHEIYLYFLKKISNSSIHPLLPHEQS